MKNKLSDLNDHLFAQIERLGDESLKPEQIDAEVKRGEAIVKVSEQIVSMAALQVQAAKVMVEYGNDPSGYLPQIGEKKPANGGVSLIEAKKR
ncbi:MAG: hypothetical protein AB7O46_00260 [Xanthobacteraceae bacterium]